MTSADPARPNIVFILSDDQGAWALGASGNDEILTPNLDALAASGARLNRFFCASPICSPARASLLTGQIPSQHGVLDYLATRHVGTDAVDYLAGRTLVTEMLAVRGYRCGLSGKWHLGANDRARTGFVHWFAHQSGAGPYFDAPVVRDGQLTTEPRYITEAITDDAIEFVEREATTDGPFWLSLHYTAPHFPWAGNHPAEYTSLYDDCTFESAPQEPAHPNLRVGPDGRAASLRTEPDVRSALVGYYASVTAMDASIGRVVTTLDRLGLRENTLIIFTSDNGFNCGHHGVWGKGNGTFPQNMYDSSVLVPAICSQPGRIPAGIIADQLLSAYDVAPTILDWVGADDVTMPHGPGRSFAPLLEGATVPEQERVVVFDEYGPVRMIRTPDWKYVHRYPGGPHELYNLLDDPGEQTNLISDAGRAAVVHDLRTQLTDWFAAYVEPEHDARVLGVTGWGQRSPIGESPFIPAHGPLI